MYCWGFSVAMARPTSRDHRLSPARRHGRSVSQRALVSSPGRAGRATHGEATPAAMWWETLRATDAPTSAWPAWEVPATYVLRPVPRRADSTAPLTTDS